MRMQGKQRHSRCISLLQKCSLAEKLKQSLWHAIYRQKNLFIPCAAVMICPDGRHTVIPIKFYQYSNIQLQSKLQTKAHNSRR